jgi:hypothetical protein
MDSLTILLNDKCNIHWIEKDTKNNGTNKNEKPIFHII